jgi:hypothetical protein
VSLGWTQRQRHGAIGVGVALIALLLAGCASGRGTTKTTAHRTHSPIPAASVRAASTTTTTHVFAAFDSSGAPAAGVGAHRSGTCFASSITVAARSAYRCFAGNRLLDPCFVVPGSGERSVDCYADPWSAATLLRLKSAAPGPGAPLKIAQPWAVRLVDGVRCVVTTGTTRLLHQIPMRYQCTGSVIAGLLPGHTKQLTAQVRQPGGAIKDVLVAATWTA